MRWWAERQQRTLYFKQKFPITTFPQIQAQLQGTHAPQVPLPDVSSQDPGFQRHLVNQELTSRVLDGLQAHQARRRGSSVPLTRHTKATPRTCNPGVRQPSSFGLSCPCAHHPYLERSPYALRSKPARHLSYLALGKDTCKFYFTHSVTEKDSTILVTVTCTGPKSVPSSNEETGRVSQFKTGNEKDNLPDDYNVGTAVLGQPKVVQNPFSNSGQEQMLFKELFQPPTICSSEASRAKVNFCVFGNIQCISLSQNGLVPK